MFMGIEFFPTILPPAFIFYYVKFKPPNVNIFLILLLIVFLGVLKIWFTKLCVPLLKFCNKLNNISFLLFLLSLDVIPLESHMRRNLFVFITFIIHIHIFLQNTCTLLHLYQL